MPDDAPTPPIFPDMHLVCSGATVAPVETRADQTVTSESERAQSTTIARTPSQIAFQVQFRIKASVASMYVPPAASGMAASAAKWLPVTRLQLTDDEITGRVNFGFWRGSSDFRIDRRTGTINSDGGFSGVCAKVDQADRKF